MRGGQGQLTLFEPEAVVRAEVRAAVAEMRFADAERLIEEQRSLLEQPALCAAERLVCHFFLEHPLDSPLQHRWETWWHFVAYAGRERIPQSLVRDLERSYFLKAIDQCGLEGVEPFLLGRCLLAADRASRCVDILMAAIRAGDQRRGVFVLLANARYRLGEHVKARPIYLQGLLRPEDGTEVVIVPEDPEVRALFQSGVPRRWQAVEGILAGVFPTPRLETPDLVRQVIDEFHQFCQRWRFDESEVGPLLFHRGLLLSSNPRCVPHEFLVRLRMDLRSIHPEYFERHMAQLRQRELEI